MQALPDTESMDHAMDSPAAKDVRTVRTVPWWVGPAFAVLALGTVPWVVYLAVSLPRHATFAHYRAVWVGFDCGLIVVLGLTALLAWLRRPQVALTAVVPATTNWQEFPALWGQLLGEVWDCLRAGGIDRGCRNIMLYRDSVPNVEVGVLLDRPCPLTGRVVASELPAGPAAMTVHRGS